MGYKYLRQKPLSLVQQQIRIFQLYGNIIRRMYIENSMLVCIIDLQPSAESDVYRIKITYKLSDKAPTASLLSPEMQTYDGKYPHHQFGKDQDGHYLLCVYYPKYKEWTQQMYIAESFIPWICTWLNAYEYWLITGEWHYDEKLINPKHKKMEG